MHTNNPVIKIIQTIFQTEIANPITNTAHSLTITLPDNQSVIIGAILTTAPLYKVPPFAIRTERPHTFHYDTYQSQIKTSHTQATNPRLTLLSLADCQSYLDDICHNLLNTTCRDLEITFPDGSKYLIVATTAEKHDK